jgi:selenocysteine-specific translation elongation factor
VAASVTVALLGSRELGAQLGKKGTASDLTLYNAVRDGHAATLIEPTGFPERFPPLLYALAMGDRAILQVDALTRPLAETIATADLFALPTAVRLGPSVGAEEVRRALKGTSLDTADIAPLDLPNLRHAIDEWRASPRDGPVEVRIDHAFPVKGVGAVALGVVRQGTLHPHDRLRLYPSPTVVEVRSVQVHDIDAREAGTGERVGVALKGVEATDLSRGQALAPDGSLQVGQSLTGTRWIPCRYYKGSLNAGDQVHALVGLQFVPAKWTGLNGSAFTLTPDRPVAFAAGEPVFVADLSATAGPRIVGRGSLG